MPGYPASATGCKARAADCRRPPPKKVAALRTGLSGIPLSRTLVLSHLIIEDAVTRVSKTLAVEPAANRYCGIVLLLILLQ